MKQGNELRIKLKELRFNTFSLFSAYCRPDTGLAAIRKKIFNPFVVSENLKSRKWLILFFNIVVLSDRKSLSRTRTPRVLIHKYVSVWEEKVLHSWSYTIYKYLVAMSILLYRYLILMKIHKSSKMCIIKFCLFFLLS